MSKTLDFERFERRMKSQHRTILDFLMTHKIPPKMYYDWKKNGDPRLSSVEKLIKALGYKIEFIPVDGVPDNQRGPFRFSQDIAA